MLHYLLKTSELSALFRFVSPDFFKVVPVADLLSIANQLRKNSLAVQEYESLQSSIKQWTEKRWPLPPLSSQAASSRGDQILELYFFQIFASESWLLDFRGAAFPSAGSGGPFAWAPGPYFWNTSPSFRQGIRDLYAGFYEGKPNLFETSLEELQLKPAREAFLKHFGTGDQTAVRFELKAFQNTFAEVFEACARVGTRIPAEFGVLGILLLTLYENLEERGPFDVRGAYFRAKEEAARCLTGNQPQS